MVTKKLVQLFINKYSKDLIRLLNLEDKQIKFHVYKSTSKAIKKLGVKRCNRVSTAGISYVNDLGADIIIYYDYQKDKKDVLGTIFHELLHIRMYNLTKLITLKSDTAEYVEEDLVVDLENTFLKYTKLFK